MVSEKKLLNQFGPKKLYHQFDKNSMINLTDNNEMHEDQSNSLYFQLKFKEFGEF